MKTGLLRHAATAGTSRQGRTLQLIRLLWLLAAISAVVVFVAALPLRWQALSRPSALTQANLEALGIPLSAYAAWSLFWELVIVLPWVVTGLLILRRSGEQPMALFTALVLVHFGVGSGTLAPTMQTLQGRNAALDVYLHGVAFVAWYGVTLFFYLFPSGKWAPSWMRWVALGLLPIYLLWNFAPSAPGSPLTWSPAAFGALTMLIWLSWGASQVYRNLRVAGVGERRQTRLVTLAVAALVLTMVVLAALGALVPGYSLMGSEQGTPQAEAFALLQWPFALVAALLPISIGAAIARRGLWNIDRLVSRAAVWCALATFVVLVYVGVVGSVSRLLSAGVELYAALAATTLIALLFAPLHAHLQKLVSRWLYGRRDDPYSVLSNLSHGVEGVMAPEQSLQVVVETIQAALKLPAAAILVREGEGEVVAAAIGALETAALQLPLTCQRETVGTLRVALRSDDEPFSLAERGLLETIAAQVGVVVHTMRLTNDLRQARTLAVSAREEERRRLRRDLHDGLGPRQAAQSLMLQAALDSLERDTPTAQKLLSTMLEESQLLIADIRRIVHGLRPPALDQLGLMPALREQAARIEGGGLRVQFDLPATLPPLPAAAEVAVYRILQESLTNVARHARATSCHVRLAVLESQGPLGEVERSLHLVVADNGLGIEPEARAGVGLLSMRERAEEIGGWCRVEAASDGGTIVAIGLPLPAPQERVP